jgi:hypothetical protein
MLEIIPAIMPRNYEDLKNRVALVRGIVPLVQIDICDGIFVKNQTWPYDEPSRKHMLPRVTFLERKDIRDTKTHEA